MTPLEEYRDKLPRSYHTPMGDSEETHQIGITQGFDAAIALDLPVKFMNWTNEGDCQYQLTDEDQWTIYGEDGHTNYSTRDVYEYWLNTIYKPE